MQACDFCRPVVQLDTMTLACKLTGIAAGLLAAAQRERYYHSQAWLTQNAEVLTAGSEPTEDYTIQIYTPPYLTGDFNR